MWEYFCSLIKWLQQIPEFKTFNGSMPDLISSVFPNVHYVWITRGDKIRQAVSHDKALQTGLHHWQDGKYPVWEKQPIFNYARINYLYHRIIAHEEAWQKYFSYYGISPFRVVYEDFVDRYEQVIREILDYLQIPALNRIRFGPRKLRKMADDLNEEWVQQYREKREHIEEDCDRIIRLIAKWSN
jgi:LPS sulfotransferase NodH